MSSDIPVTGAIGPGDRLSRHFRELEFRCHHCGRLPHVSHRLVQLLEDLRAITGQPLRVVSGYRCPEWNRQVGGAESSRHLFADAADLDPGRFTLDAVLRLGATGVGTKGQWVTHVDVGHKEPTHWRYPV